MNQKKRVALCISQKDTDLVPWQIDCTSELAERLMKAFGLAEKRHPVRFVHGRNIYRYNALNDYLVNHPR